MVGLKTGPMFYKIGTGSILHSFFSTIAYNLEDNNWGKKYPFIMKELYNGELSSDKILNAEKELAEIKEALKEYAPNCIIWDIDNLELQPPWGEKIADRITSLSNYFYTSDGEDIFNLFIRAFNDAKQIKKSVCITSI
ncbi:immunity 70 family protein [Sphingobacterium detergens]